VSRSDETAGHGTTAQAKGWKVEFDAWLRGVPRRGN